MFSNRRTETRPGWHPGRWSLRTKLLAAVLALFAVVSVSVGVVSTVALRHFLLGRLDDQLTAVAARAAGPGEFPGNAMPPPNLNANPPSGDTIPLGQPIGSVTAHIDNGQLTSAVILTDVRTAGQRSAALTERLTTAQSAPLLTVAQDRHAHSVTLPDLGNYRVLVQASHYGDLVVAGLPLSDVDDAVMSLVWTEAVLVGLGLLLAAAAGVVIVRLSLRPLSRVAATAGRVAELPLARGEVDLSVRVPDADTDTRTEVGQVGAALNRMLGHVATALSARQASETRVRQFVADASHELRTPLAAIRGYAELTRRGREPVAPDIAHALRRIESEGARMTTLVDDLLLLARLDAAAVTGPGSGAARPLERAPVQLSGLVVDAVNDAHAAGLEHRWRLEVPDQAITVPGDSGRLHQVLANLLSNARTHTPPGTTVTTSLTVAQDAALITVQDDGPGIPADLLPDIFERFTRADSSRSRAAGSTGLGLAIVAAVVEAHAGSVTVTSRPGSTRFTVRLPDAAID
jgi:two-component system OmpR family sensor kinase